MIDGERSTYLLEALIGLGGLAYMAFLMTQKLKKARREKEEKQKKEAVPCIFCGGKVYGSDSRNGLYKCRYCRRHFVYRRKSTEEEKRLTGEEGNDVIALKNFLEDTQTSYRMVLEHIACPGWYAAHVAFADGWKEIRIRVQVREGTAGPGARYDRTDDLSPLPVPFLNIRTEAGAACFLHLLEEYINTKRAPGLEAVFSADSLELMISNHMD